MAVKVRLAAIQDIAELCNLLHKVQEEKNVGKDQVIDNDSFAEYMMGCIFSGGIYSFVAVDDENIVGLLVLSEVTCPWNHSYVHGTDHLFIALKGGPRLIETAKQLAKKKNWQSLIFSTSMSNERTDKYFQKIATPIGGNYKIEVR